MAAALPEGKSEATEATPGRGASEGSPFAKGNAPRREGRWHIGVRGTRGSAIECGGGDVGQLSELLPPRIASMSSSMLERKREYGVRGCDGHCFLETTVLPT